MWEDRQSPSWPDLVRDGTATVKRTAAQGRRVLAAIREWADGPKARGLAERLAEIVPRLKRGVGQAERRVLEDDPTCDAPAVGGLNFAPQTRVPSRLNGQVGLCEETCGRPGGGVGSP